MIIVCAHCGKSSDKPTGATLILSLALLTGAVVLALYDHWIFALLFFISAGTVWGAHA